MKYNFDKQLRGHACAFDNPLEMIDCVTKAVHKGKAEVDFGWEKGPDGVYVKSMADVKSLFFRPWAVGIAKVKDMLETMRHQQLPQPKDRRRRPYWSDVDGAIDIDRVMAGEAEYMRAVRRQVTHGPTTVTLLSNLDGDADHDSDRVFWRGAAAIATCDLLEAAGYQTEVWLWNAGHSVYASPNDKQFTTVRLKAAGEDLNINSIINSLSAWFLRTVVFPSFHCADAVYRAVGGMDYKLDNGWRKYMDVTEGVLGLEMPITSTKEESIACAVKLLTQVEEAYS